MKNNRSSIVVVVLSLLILVGIIFFGGGRRNIGNISGKNPQDPGSLIKDIQESVRLIDLERDYEVKTLNNEKFLDHMTDGGGQLVGYFKDGKIKKVVERLGLSYGVKTYEYYFSNQQLIFANEKEEDFPDINDTGTLDYTKLVLAFEGYYYFDDEKLISAQTTGKKRFPTNTATSSIESSFVIAARQNIELLLKAQ